MKKVMDKSFKNSLYIIGFFFICLAVLISFHLFSNKKVNIKSSTLTAKLFAEGGVPTGWQFIDGYWYYIESSGAYKTGWYQSEDRWYYFDTDGKMVTGIKYVPEDSAYYYFSEKESTIGIMQSGGWRRSKDNWYYLNSNGKAKTNEWYNDGGYYYYFKEDGKAAKGVTYVPDDDEYYYLSMVDASYGMMEKSKWVEYNGDWYYVNDNGKLKRNDWKISGSNSYYFDNDGKMATGFREISGNTYYFSEKTSGDSINNVEVHIKNQTDLNNYLSSTGQNILGDRVYFENTSNIQFPANAVYYLDITSDGLAGGDYATFWYLTSKSTGNIDFNSSTFLIGEGTSIYMHATGDHQNQIFKNATFFGSIDAEYSGGSPVYNRGNFNADLIHASNITFKNLEFNVAQEVEDHIFDVMGCDNITFDHLTFRGFLNDYSSSELNNVYYSYGYKEAIQIDSSNPGASGISDLDKTPIFNNDLADNEPTSNLTITNSYFGPYNGATGQDIINKNNSTTVRPFGPTVGAHVKGYDYENITITNNTFADTFCISNISDKKYLYPIHLMPVLDGYDVSSNTFINQCGYSGDNGDTDSWDTKGFYGRNDSYSSNNTMYDDDNINSTPIDTSSIKSKVNTLSYSYGSAQTGFVVNDSNTYYFRESDNDVSTGPKASMVLGLATINNNTYYFRETADSNGPKGSMLKNECKLINSTYYCFNSSGVGQAFSIATIPTSSSCLNPTYDGNPKTLANAQIGYTLSNNSETNAGNYTVTASLSSGYVWSDYSTSDKSFNCSISKANLQAPNITNYSGTYDGSAHQISLSNSSGMTVNYSTDGTSYSSTIPTRTNAGTTTIYVKYIGNNNYNDSSVSTGSITISKANPVITKTNEYNEINAGYQGSLLSISSNVAGTFIFSTESSKLEISTGPTVVTANESINLNINALTEGNANINIVFVPSDSTNYNEYQGIKNVVINEQMIVNSIATIPTSNDYCKTNLVYDGNEKTLTNSHGEGYTFINNTGTNAGIYTVSAVLDEHYEWSDSSTTNKTFNCSIAKANTVTPNVTSYNGTYDGLSHQVSLTNATGMTVNYSTDGTNYSSVVPSRINAGTTNVYVKYSGDSNHNDSSIANGTITITKADPVITKTNIVNEFNIGDDARLLTVSSNVPGMFSFSTNGDKVQINSLPEIVTAGQNVDLNISAVKKGNSSVNISFIPTDTTNYNEYSYDQSVTVNNKISTIPTAANYCKSNLSYNENEQTLTNSPGEGYTFDNNTGTNAGNYNVTAHLNSNYEWSDNTTSDKVIVCSINKVKHSAPIITNYSNYYDGEEHTITLVNGSNKTINYSTDGFTFNSTIPKRTNAGTTNVYVKYLEDTNYLESDVSTGSITINKVDSVVTRTNEVSSMNANEEGSVLSLASNIAGTFTFTSSDSSIELLNSSVNVIKNQTIDLNIRALSEGSATVNITFTPSDSTNYNGYSGTKSITINPQVINNDIAIIPTESIYCKNNLVYSGNEQVLTNTHGTGYTFKNNTGTNAGNYIVSAVLDENYEWFDSTTGNKTITCSISKADLNIPTITGYNGTYDGNPHGITTTDIPEATIKYSLDNNNYTTFVPTRTDVGTTQVYVKYFGDNNHNDSSVYSTNIVINKANSVISSLNLVTEINKNQELEIGPVSSNTAGIFTITSNNSSVLSTTDLYKSVSQNEQVTFNITGASVGTTSYTITFTPTSSNYESSVVTTNIEVLEKPKTPVLIPTSNLYCKTNLKYTGNAMTITNEPLQGYTFSNNVQTNPGTYEVTAKLIDGYIWSDNTFTDKTFNCVILNADSYLTFDNKLRVEGNNLINVRRNPGITNGEIKSLISTNGTITTTGDDNTIAKTCDNLSIELNDVVQIYKLIITGDITKNGSATNDDVQLLFRYLRKKTSLDDCQIKASDTTDDNSIHINDVAKLYQYVNGKIGGLIN